MIIPEFLKKGDTIGVTAPSSGIRDPQKMEKMAYAKQVMAEKGFNILETKNVYTADERGCSGTGAERGKQFNELVANKEVKAIYSASGGDFLMEMLPYVDYDMLCEKPKWFEGYSDNTSLVYSIVTKCDTAAIYGGHFGEFGTKPWNKSIHDMYDVITGCNKNLRSYDYYEDGFMQEKSSPFDGNSKDKPVCWVNGRGEEKIEIQGRILGGCLDVLIFLIGTKYDGTLEFIEKYKDDGIVWILESFDMSDNVLITHLWQMKECGYFRTAKGFVFGRPLMYNSFLEWDYKKTVMSVLGDLDVPVIFDADIGHKSPQLPIIEGVIGKFTSAGGKGTLEYRF